MNDAGLEIWIRLGAFIGVFALLALWETIAPLRRRSIGRTRRWPGNLGVTIIDAVVVRILFPAAAAGMALTAEARGWGLLNQIALPDWASIFIAVVALDLILYAQHVLFHAVPGLWRLHRMHHADLDLDVTTGVRFHPVEIVLSMLIKFAAVVALGVPILAVLIFEIVLNAAAMFNHSNIRLGSGVDRVLRLVLVTPAMHHVHHSVVRRETDSNYGFCLPWWDHLFKTYRRRPEAGYAAMTIGLAGFRDPGELRLDRMLIQPLRGDEAASRISKP